MTVADWLTESRQRFREQPTNRALAISVERFIHGARAHIEWYYANYVKREPTIRTTFGDVHPRFRVDSREEIKRAKHAIRERPVLEWFLAPIEPGWTVWDVGAYHGTYAITCALAGAEVLAFEPDQTNRSRLDENIALNGTAVIVRAVALSDTAGMVDFGGDPINPRKGISSDGHTSVIAKRGDELCKSVNPPDAIKIDVEGHELAVLDGLGEYCESIDRALVEVHDGIDPRAVRDRLESAGMDTHVRQVDRPQPYVCGVRE